MTVMPLGGVARLEHPLTNFDGSRAAPCLLSRTSRRGLRLRLAAELDLKRAELAEIEVDLANDGDSADTAGLGDDSRAAA